MAGAGVPLELVFGGLALEQAGRLAARAAVEARVGRARRGRRQRGARAAHAQAHAPHQLRAPVRRRAALLQRQQRAAQPHV